MSEQERARKDDEAIHILSQRVLDLESLLSQEKERHRWIPVSERLPENDSDVLVILEKYKPESKWKRRTVALWDEPKGLWFDEKCNVVNVTHWQPLPAPPEGEKEA